MPRALAGGLARARRVLESMAESSNQSLNLDVRTDLACVPDVRRAVEDLLEAIAWTDDDREDVGLIVTEAVQNAIEHGSRADGTEIVRVHVAADSRRIALTVEDPGTGRDPQRVLHIDATQVPPFDSPRGRGLFLIHKLATSFACRIGADGGLCVTVDRRAGSP